MALILLETVETMEEPRNGNRRMNMRGTQANSAVFTFLVHHHTTTTIVQSVSK